MCELPILPSIQEQIASLRTSEFMELLNKAIQDSGKIKVVTLPPCKTKECELSRAYFKSIGYRNCSLEQRLNIYKNLKQEIFKSDTSND